MTTDTALDSPERGNLWDGYVSGNTTTAIMRTPRFSSTVYVCNAAAEGRAVQFIAANFGINNSAGFLVKTRCKTQLTQCRQA